MTQRSKLAPPNSVILVMDPSARDLPKSMGNSAVAATTSAIAIACQAEIDGETEIHLGWGAEVDPGSPPAYVGQIDTPTGVVSVRTVLDAEILSLQVTRKKTTLRVWVNDPKEPTLVIVGVS